jgi:hypothetical protein
MTNARPDVIIYTSSSSYAKIEKIVDQYSPQLSIEVIEFIKSSNSLDISNYSNYGTQGFNYITSIKWDVILKTLDKHYETVVYADCDLVFIADFSDYIKSSSHIFACGIQSESSPSFPPNYCTGFMYFTRGAADFLKKLSTVNVAYAHKYNDQDVFNMIIKENPHVVKDLLALPEALFQNGLLYQTHSGAKFPELVGELRPYLFHANYVIGVENKINLLKRSKLWFLLE